MRLHILSDLHQEFAPYTPRVTDADVIVLAGDTHTGLNGIRWAQKTFPNTPVIYLAGNHEYYGQNLLSFQAKAHALAKGTNVHFLENGRVSIGDTTFLGCTLWTDMALLGNVPLAEADAVCGMSDYKKIRVEPNYSKLRPKQTRRLHAASLEWLQQELEGIAQQGSPNQKVVVVTHHAPSLKSVAEHFKTDILSAAYASNLDGFIHMFPSNLWIHGHVHWASDYVLGTTRVVANPRGYPQEGTHGFDPRLVVEV